MQYTLTLNLSGLACPLLILKTKKALTSLEGGQTLQILCTDPSAFSDVSYFCEKTGHPLLKSWQENDQFCFVIQKSP